jgi:deoxycytidine triphosphate deaminase
MWSRKWHNLPPQTLMDAEWSGSITALLSNLDNILSLVLTISW